MYSSSDCPEPAPLGGQGQVFDPAGLQFNGTTPVHRPVHFVTRVPNVPGVSKVPAWQPTTRTSFANASDVTNTAQRVDAPASPVAYDQLNGSFSGLRAAQSLRQHQIDFWGDAGIVQMVMASNAPDPSKAQIDQMYSDMQLFSYMPANLLPAPADFANQVTPSQMVAACQQNLMLTGIIPDTVWTPPTESAPSVPVISALPAYADQLTNWCAAISFINQTNQF